MDPKRHPLAEKAGMPLRTYSGSVDEFPDAHLVVTTVRSKAALQHGKQLLARLLKALKPKGHYALGELQDGNHFAVHCLFEREEDGIIFGRAGRATLAGRCAGFGTQRAFLLDHGAYKSIKTVLAELEVLGAARASSAAPVAIALGSSSAG